MKKVTWNGQGNLLLPGQKDPLTSGGSAVMSDKAADELVAANPHLDLTVEDAPDKGDKSEKD